MNNILAIGAHFDDVELGVGGTLSKLKSDKPDRKIYKLTLTNNITNFKHKNINVDFESSLKESEQACKILGISQINITNYVGCTELIFNKKQMQDIESFIFDMNIDTVFCHYPSDIQQDHEHASKISFVAGRYCENIIFYQSNRYILPQSFYPRIYSDITSSIDLKKKSLKCYSSDHNRNNKLFDQTILQNQVWGYQFLLKQQNIYAEAFSPLKFKIF